MRISKVVMAILYVAAGSAHFLATRRYVSIVPDYLPAHRELVLISGAVEIAAGIGLLIPKTQRTAAWVLIALLLAVFPANVWMIQHPQRYPMVPLWALWLRLPLQLPLLWWAWIYTRRHDPQR